MRAAARRALHGDLAPLIPRALSADRCLEAFTMTTAREPDRAMSVVAKTRNAELVAGDRYRIRCADE
jgi:hypothetical protein